MKQSQETVNRLSKEDQEKLDTLINKSKEEPTESAESTEPTETEEPKES